MTLQQLRYLCGIADHRYNVSAAAKALHTSQPGISKQVQMLERELGVEILVRQGNRIAGLTPAGRDMLATARRMLADSDNLRRIGDEHAHEAHGRLVLATTHIYARYVLRSVIGEFTRKFADIRLALRQGNPEQVAQWVAAGEVDVGISGKPPEVPPEVLCLPCGELQRSVIAPAGHPLLDEPALTLAALARYPLITLDTGFVGGWAVVSAFRDRGIEPNIVLSATDADVIKSYVELGLGVAVLPSVAYEAGRDSALRAIDARHLFAPTVTQIQLRRGGYLRGYLVDFLGRVDSGWTRAELERAVMGPAA